MNTEDKAINFQKVYPQNIPAKNEIQAFLANFNALSNHQKIIQKALKIAKSLPQIEAVLLLGSLAIGRADIFSDIDFYIVIKEKNHLEQIKQHFLHNLNEIGAPIHVFESNAYPNSSIIYFKPFVKFELVIEDYNKLVKNWRVGRVVELLFDRNGLGARAIQTAKKIKFDLKKYQNEIKNVAIELPSFCYNIAGYILRGEYITSIDFIAWIRRLLLRICGFFLEVWDEGTRRAELRFPEEVINYYYRCQLKEKDDIWLVLHSILDWYSNWLVPRFELHEINHANEEIPIIRYILKESEKIYNIKTKND
jgi:predicted nucleotidyltransferase